MKEGFTIPGGNLAVTVPSEIFDEEFLSPLAKHVYAAVCHYKPRSLHELSRCAKISRKTVIRIVDSLARAGWVRITGTSHRKVLIPTMPDALQKARLEDLKVRKALAPHAGEFLLKAMLDQVVDSQDFVDNARPWFLQSGTTGEFLEFDRYYYVHKVAVEFNGRQHYETTPEFPDQAAVDEIKERDRLKAEICKERGIILVTVVPEDLVWSRLLNKLPGVLPRKLVDTKGPYAVGLEELCKEYIAHYRRAKNRDRRQLGELPSARRV